MGREKAPNNERDVYKKIRQRCAKQNIGYIKIPDSVVGGSVKRFIPEKVCDIILINNNNIAFLEVKYIKKQFIHISKRLINQIKRLEELRRLSGNNIRYFIIIYSSKSNSYYAIKPLDLIQKVLEQGDMVDINSNSFFCIDKDGEKPKIELLFGIGV